MNRRQGIRLLGLVTIAVLVTAVAAGATPSTPTRVADDPYASAPQPLTTPEEFDDTLFRIRLYENRSATWTIQHSRPLRNETQVENFEAFAAEFRQSETRPYTNFRDRARSLVSFGENVTNRSMRARQFSRDAHVTQLGQTRGVLELSFTWTNFTQANGERILVGDVFQGGMFVDGGQRLELRRGPTLAFVDVQPEPDSMASGGNLTASESVTWLGEVQFADQRPAATLAARDDVAGPAGGDDGTGGPAPGPADPVDGDAGGMVPMALAGLLVVLAVAGGAAWYGGYLPPAETESTDAPADAAEGETDRGTGSQVAGGGGATAQVTEAELLSDEDRVISLLEDNDGRMKQVAIVDQTEWSKSKVSMLLSDMEDDGQISKLRLGRENIISLAGQEPDAAGSPFEDE